MRSMLKITLAAMATTALFAVPSHAEGLKGDLKIFLDTSNPAPRAAMEGMIDRFQKKNPDLKIETTIIDREAYKTQIRNFLTANAPDVATWYAANRMKPYVDAGLFDDVSDVWKEDMFVQKLGPSKAALTLNGKQWGVPYSFYQWGVYYRKDIYDKLGISEPKNFAEMKSNCQKILDSGKKCYTIGTKFLWTAAGWFDYLNMRTHGFEFHIELLQGKVAWTDDRVKQTFANWRELIDMGAYIDNHTSYSWQEAVPFMTEEKDEAAAYLMGNFAVDAFRSGGLDDSKLDFYQFPTITEGVTVGEDAPMDTFHIPAQAKNKDNARAFLRYVADAENQTIINKKLGQLPVNSDSSVADDKFLNEGSPMLNAADGVAQFFDRDAPAEMAKVAMDGFQKFMVKPDELDRILQKLERARKRIYK